MLFSCVLQRSKLERAYVEFAPPTTHPSFPAILRKDYQVLPLGPVLPAVLAIIFLVSLSCSLCIYVKCLRASVAKIITKLAKKKWSPSSRKSKICCCFQNPISHLETYKSYRSICLLDAMRNMMENTMWIDRYLLLKMACRALGFRQYVGTVAAQSM